ncbi:MAG TPA: thrombospondin type 3 repeat-containing protein [Thermoanaerobaculia bacterium]|jgi:hypothetical protein|nr:thrombospondin type 3 repeat-containing protein [Thermoanaerobaculia bacterium]
MNGKLCLAALTTLCCCLFLPTAASAQWCHDQDTTWWCGDPNACEGVCSEPGATCDTYCEQWGQPTTCGGGGNDYDGDGVANASDNCLCNANSNQADCDTDGMGDVCDPANEKWVQIQYIFNACAWDGDAHWNSWAVQLYNATVYRNTCDNSTCVKKHLIDDGSCCYYVCAGGENARECCYHSFNNNPACGNTPDDQCGQPQCPF